MEKQCGLLLKTKHTLVGANPIQASLRSQRLRGRGSWVLRRLDRRRVHLRVSEGERQVQPVPGAMARAARRLLRDLLRLLRRLLGRERREAAAGRAQHGIPRQRHPRFYQRRELDRDRSIRAAHAARVISNFEHSNVAPAPRFCKSANGPRHSAAPWCEQGRRLRQRRRRL